MGFFGKDNLTDSESGNWNTAENYSQIKIMNLLAIADEYEEMAEFGSLNIIDELQNKDYSEELKIRAFKRLINHLIRVCRNSWFALEKHPTAKENIEKYIKELQTIRDEKMIKLFSFNTNQINKTKSLKINNEYYLTLERVSEIKKEINQALNQADLIFIHKENFNPKDYKKRIFEDAISRG
jgi:hypothetical protein